MLKRGYTGTFYQRSANHLERYVTEFEVRHNSRPTGHGRPDDTHGCGSHWQAASLPYAELIG